jgi:hypothetical protein
MASGVRTQQSDDSAFKRVVAATGPPGQITPPVDRNMQMCSQTELGESINELDMGIDTRGRASRLPLHQNPGFVFSRRAPRRTETHPGRGQ